MPEVIEIVVDPRLHLFELRCLASATVDLREAGDAGQHFVPHHVALDELAVFLVVRHGVGPGAHETHAALKHIDELRQLIQGGASENAADARDAAVGPRRLPDLLPVLGHAHGPEFVHRDLASIQTVTALLEYDGPGR